MGPWPSLESAATSAAVTRAPDFGEPVRAWRPWCEVLEAGSVDIVQEQREMAA
jgi:hypothetical protein